jgi:hypothetical protein
MNSTTKNLLRFILLVLVQVFVLDKIRIHQMLTPYLYMLFILWLPFRINRALLMILAFILGLTIDSFRHHPGFHAAACVFIDYVRPFIINLLIPQEGAETNFDEPSFRSMGGFLPYFIYLTTLILIHHMWLFMLEAWQFADGWYFLIKSLGATILSLVLILITELLFSRNQRFKTNTV